MTLRWDHHLNELCERLRKTIYRFRILKTLVDKGCLKVIYFSLAQSLILYGIVGWGGTSFLHIEPLLRVQRLIMRVINQKHPRYSSDQLFNEFDVMDPRQLYSKEILCRLHKNPIQTRNHNHNTDTGIFSLPMLQGRHYTREISII
ncbi:uncharacterized protein LOC120352629 [Nilaparvata lugens]|uniref:uncharacterized protein LOC120352629 n=1 Tax=Nilaparvata lugens TaxID=108931 RepID=UPI00193CEF9B|nr:uncharacterized protein LOC120352629 [Nilaparvata lugens]